MFVALYGELVLHEWRGRNPEHDAYSLFVQRSTAMGWSDEDEAGLWLMNDAGWSHPLAPKSANLASWYQVEANEVTVDRPLPVQPFLHCAWETTTRVGRLQLDTVQLLLPVQGLVNSRREGNWALPSMRTIHWFGEAAPESRTRVEVWLESGQDPANAIVAQHVTNRLGLLDQSVFTYEECDVRGEAPGIPLPFDDSFWNGPVVQRLRICGELVEWSPDAIGWLAETVADCVARLGGQSPIALTIKQR